MVILWHIFPPTEVMRKGPSILGANLPTYLERLRTYEPTLKMNILSVPRSMPSGYQVYVFWYRHYSSVYCYCSYYYCCLVSKLE